MSDAYTKLKQASWEALLATVQDIIESEQYNWDLYVAEKRNRFKAVQIYL